MDLILCLKCFIFVSYMTICYEGAPLANGEASMIDTRIGATNVVLKCACSQVQGDQEDQDGECGNKVFKWSFITNQPPSNTTMEDSQGGSEEKDTLPSNIIMDKNLLTIVEVSEVHLGHYTCSAEGQPAQTFILYAGKDSEETDNSTNEENSGEQLEEDNGLEKENERTKEKERRREEYTSWKYGVGIMLATMLVAVILFTVHYRVTNEEVSDLKKQVVVFASSEPAVNDSVCTNPRLQKEGPPVPTELQDQTPDTVMLGLKQRNIKEQELPVQLEHEESPDGDM